MTRGSKVVYCPDCGTPHLARVMRRVPGGWQIRCRWCGLIDWRARL